MAAKRGGGGGGEGGKLAPGFQPTRAPNLRINLRLSKAPLNQGECKTLRLPFRGNLNTLEYCPPVFSDDEVIGAPDIILRIFTPNYTNIYTQIYEY